MSKILVVIDMQTEFLKQCRAENLAADVEEKIRRRKSEGYEVLLTLDKSGGLLVDGIARESRGCKIYKKHSYGCKELILDLAAAQPEKVEFVGVCTDICVIANVLGTMAFLPFAEISVDGSCCASADGGHSAALSVMRACNITVS